MFLYVSFAAVLLELVHLRSSDVARYLPLDHTFGVCVGVPLRQWLICPCWSCLWVFHRGTASCKLPILDAVRSAFAQSWTLEPVEASDLQAPPSPRIPPPVQPVLWGTSMKARARVSGTCFFFQWKRQCHWQFFVLVHWSHLVEWGCIVVIVVMGIQWISTHSMHLQMHVICFCRHWSRVSVTSDSLWQMCPSLQSGQMMSSLRSKRILDCITLKERAVFRVFCSRQNLEGAALALVIC